MRTRRTQPWGCMPKTPAMTNAFISDELPALGIAASKRQVWLLCSPQRLRSVFSKKRGLNRKAGAPIRDHLAQRGGVP